MTTALVPWADRPAAHRLLMISEVLRAEAMKRLGDMMDRAALGVGQLNMATIAAHGAMLLYSDAAKALVSIPPRVWTGRPR